MAPASRSRLLASVLAAACICSVGHYSSQQSFAAPRSLVGKHGTQGTAFGGFGRQPMSSQTRLAAGGGAATTTGTDAPSVTSIALQGLALLAAAGGMICATLGSKAAIQGTIGLAGLYVIMSCNEYVVHRYYQHLGINKNPVYRWLRRQLSFLPALKSSGHVEHHKETLDDMTLDQRPDPILDADPFRGTAFSWSVSAVMTLEIALQSYPWLWLCGWSLKASTAALFMAMILHAGVWQTLHPAMHDLPDPPITYGIPGWSMAKLRKTGYFKFLYLNHEGHHRAPGAHGNYNVCCPLADHLFGTYVGHIPAQQTRAAMA